MTHANEKRAERCARALAVYSGDEPFTNLVDFLADAMHWSHFAGEDFHWALAQACHHYFHEMNDQPQDERRLIP
jgi:hypothetical protein